MSDKYTTARLTKGQDHFEILVKPQPALDYKLGKQVPISQVLLIEEIYSDSSKGTRASEEKLQKYFGSTDPQLIAEEVMKSGELGYRRVETYSSDKAGADAHCGQGLSRACRESIQHVQELRHRKS